MPEVGESRWTDQDREIAIAWFEYLDGLCGGCGVPRDEAWTKKAKGKWQPKARRCHVCAAQEAAVEQHHQSAAAADALVTTHGLKGTAVPVPAEAS